MKTYRNEYFMVTAEDVEPADDYVLDACRWVSKKGFGCVVWQDGAAIAGWTA